MRLDSTGEMRVSDIFKCDSVALFTRICTWHDKITKLKTEFDLTIPHFKPGDCQIGAQLLHINQSKKLSAPQTVKIECAPTSYNRFLRCSVKVRSEHFKNSAAFFALRKF